MLIKQLIRYFFVTDWDWHSLSSCKSFFFVHTLWCEIIPHSFFCLLETKVLVWGAFKVTTKFRSLVPSWKVKNVHPSQPNNPFSGTCRRQELLHCSIFLILLSQTWFTLDISSKRGLFFPTWGLHVHTSARLTLPGELQAYKPDFRLCLVTSLS